MGPITNTFSGRPAGSRGNNLNRFWRVISLLLSFLLGGVAGLVIMRQVTVSLVIPAPSSLQGLNESYGGLMMVGANIVLVAITALYLWFTRRQAIAAEKSLGIAQATAVANFKMVEQMGKKLKQAQIPCVMPLEA